VGAGTKRQVLIGIEEGEELLGGNGRRSGFRPEEEDGDVALVGGSHTSVRGGEKQGYRFGLS
jgi:hypothetical protein